MHGEQFSAGDLCERAKYQQTGAIATSAFPELGFELTVSVGAVPAVKQN
jgi:hypothetical protein